MNTKRFSGRRRDPRTQVLRGALVVLLVAAAVWANFALKPVREEAAEYRWLAAHGVAENDKVVELGWQNADGRARTVIVEAQSGIQAFVDLEGSRQKVTAEGAVIPVVLDQRLSPAVGTGVAPDLLGRSFTGDYLRKGAPPAGLAILGLLAAAGWEIRRRRRVPIDR